MLPATFTSGCARLRDVTSAEVLLANRRGAVYVAAAERPSDLRRALMTNQIAGVVTPRSSRTCAGASSRDTSSRATSPSCTLRFLA